MMVQQMVQQLEPMQILSATEKIAALKKSHPAYHKAWRSMTANNSLEEVIPQWRGAEGLAQFIADTSILPNSPTTIQVDCRVMLKRIFPTHPYSPANVYWKVPVKYRSMGMSTSNPTPTTTTSAVTVDTFTAMTPQERENRFNALMEAQFEGKELTTAEQSELEILGSLITTGELPIPPASKYEDI